MTTKLTVMCGLYVIRLASINIRYNILGFTYSLCHVKVQKIWPARTPHKTGTYIIISL